MDAIDDEKLLPRATVAKFIKSKLPPGVRETHILCFSLYSVCVCVCDVGMRCGAETRELLLQSATEFVQLLSSEATEISNEQNKSKITTQHLLDAVSRLDFAQYQTEMQLIGQESHDGVRQWNTHNQYVSLNAALCCYHRRRLGEKLAGRPIRHRRSCWPLNRPCLQRHAIGPCR